MSFKDFKRGSLILEAYNNIKANNYAIITISENEKLNLEKELKDKNYKFFNIKKIPTYKTSTETILKESYIVISDDKNFLDSIIKISENFNQDNILISENRKEYIISTSKNINSYPGFGKIGVKIELSFNIFNESGQLSDLDIKEKNIENGLNIVFPTEFEFKL